MKIMSKLKETLRLYSNKYNSTIALGDTPIGSADHASDDPKLLTTMEE
jgi:hypothetical protein